MLKTLTLIRTVTTLAVLTAAPVSARRVAATADAPGPVLWQGLQAGMSVRDVRRALPHRRVQLSALCVATIEPVFAGDRLAHVTLSGTSPRGAPGLCAARVSEGLTAKYGRDDRMLALTLGYPESYPTTISPLASLHRSIDGERYAVQAWRAADTSVLFLAKRNASAWSVTYVANPAPIVASAL